MDDKHIIKLYRERNESALSETENKYGRYLRYIAYRILGDELDAEETANDTCLKLWNSIPPVFPDSLKAYAGVICRRISLDRYDRATAKKRGETALIIDELYECLPSGEDLAEKIALKAAFDSFLSSLPDRTQRVFVRRYFYASSISEIATEYSMKESAVSTLLFRTRENLKKHLEKEGF